MHTSKINSSLLTFLMGLVLFGSFLWSVTIKESVGRQTENLTAFAKLYGYVKYFHPSDEAREIDWDKFAIHGVHAVKDASDQEELQEILESLFLPIAPTLRIGLGDDQTEPFLSWYVETLDKDTARLTTVAWQHLGLDMKSESQSYDSRRVNTYDRAWDKKELWLYQPFDATELNGNQFELEAIIKSQMKGKGGEGELYITVDGNTIKQHHCLQKIRCVQQRAGKNILFRQIK